MQNNWRKELARDLIAFGGIPFLVITIVRVSVTQAYYPMQFIISSALFFILRAVFKADLRAGLALIVVTFTSFYYNHPAYTVFASLIYVGIVKSLFYLNKGKKEILKGVFLGAISATAGFFIVRAIFF